MYGLFLEMASTVLFVSSSLITSSKRTISLVGVGRLTTQKLCVLVTAVVGLLLLATAIADKHIARLLPTHVLVKCWQRI